MKRIVTIQDISCVGKCSLTVALPIISAGGIECSVLPTAVLSTHTQFKGFTFHDLTAEIAPIAAHWKELNIGFDAIYTGYLGSFEQIHLVSAFADAFGGNGTQFICDPAMADNGKLYPGFTPAFAKEMATLCAKADVILPNLTEAAYMLDRPYLGDTYTKDDIKDILRALAARGVPYPALTGIALGKNSIGVMSYDANKDTFFNYENEKLPFSCHGTGDVFASAAVAGMTHGLSREDALALAVDFTLESMKKTAAEPVPCWYGVNFEEALPLLISRLS